MDPWEAYLDDAATAADDRPVDRVVDAHTHIGKVRAGELPVTPARLVEYLDAHDVDRAVVLPLESPGAAARYVTTEDVLAAAAAFPDRLLPWCSVDPRMFRKYDDERYVEAIERYVERGARGFGEVKCALPVDHERMRMLYRICDRFDLPVLLHVDETFCTDGVGLPGVERVLEAFSDVDFVFHAHGWWAHVSADVVEADMSRYPDRPVEPGGRVDELLGYDNCHADVSMGSGFYGLTRDEAYGEELLRRHHDSLLFASDYLYPGQRVPQFGFFERFDLTDDQWADICHRNVEELMR